MKWEWNLSWSVLTRLVIWVKTHQQLTGTHAQADLLFICLQYVVYEWAVWACLSARDCCCRFTRLYINTRPLKETVTLTLLWIRCPRARAEDSLNISVQYHYETEIVFAHSWFQAGSWLDEHKTLNNEEEESTHNDIIHSCGILIPPMSSTVTLHFWDVFGVFHISSREWQEMCGERGRWWHAAKARGLIWTEAEDVEKNMVHISDH